MTKSPPEYLRRYTDLTSLLHMLTSKRITLLDPQSWDDKNDAYFMAKYKERKNLKTLLALCFSQAVETYHHWHVFSKGPSGVCIMFERKELLEALHKQAGVSSDGIKYLTMREAEEYDFELERLPFLKRAGYKPEGEFRVIYQSARYTKPVINIPITPDCIRSIILSPWLHKGLSDSAIKAVHAINDFEDLRVTRSTLISNAVWQNYAEDEANRL